MVGRARPADTVDMTRPPTVLVLIGPSASGKSNLLAELHRRGLVRVHPTWTTRPPRPGEESEPLAHVFVGDDTFDRFGRSGFFLCTGRIRGLPYRYGLPRFHGEPGGALDTVVLRAGYVTEFRRLHPGSIVYMITTAPEILSGRLSRRDDPGHVVAARTAADRYEGALGSSLADRTIPNTGSVSEMADTVETGLVADGTLTCPTAPLGVPA